jgi:hypothetical protein
MQGKMSSAYENLVADKKVEGYRIRDLSFSERKILYYCC